MVVAVVGVRVVWVTLREADPCFGLWYGVSRGIDGRSRGIEKRGWGGKGQDRGGEGKGNGANC